MLKDLRRRGIGIAKKRAEVISEELEEKLWSEGVLGDDTPEKLINTLVFVLGFSLH